MKNAVSNSVLASYATFKELYKSQKYNSPYQILAEFIRYVITANSLYSFTSTDVQGLLKEEFGFDPPIAVIRTALRSIEGVNRDHQVYTVTQKSISGSELLRTVQLRSEEQREALINAITMFANGRIEGLNRDKLQQEMVAFVLDEDGDTQYRQIIGEFILANKDNPSVTASISAIQEGGILYSGLAYNISEFGNLVHPITLFLDTEILFDIAGLNGELFKALATDFLNLVDAANRGGKMITLRYFSEVADEIDNYYATAEKVVEGKGKVALAPAMKSIVAGCEDISDVADKKTDLYRKLHIEFGIRKDERENYYTAPDLAFNLEGETIPGYSASDVHNYEGVRFCSRINVLRKGRDTTDYFSSGFLCVTDTKRVLDISRAITDAKRNPETGDRYCDYAVSLSHITNLLWYKLNRGFGATDFPRNLDAVIKSRIILSGYITQGISTTYKGILEKTASGELTQDQAVAYIVALKEKVVLPEDLTDDNLQDSLDFSEEHFNRFAETISQNSRLIKERDETIRELTGDVESLKEQLLLATESNQQKQQQIDELATKVHEIERKAAEESHKKTVRKSRLLFAWAIIWKIIVLAGIVVFTWLICKSVNADFGTWLSVVLGVGGLIAICIPIGRRDYKRHQERCKQEDDDK